MGVFIGYPLNKMTAGQLGPAVRNREKGCGNGTADLQTAGLSVATRAWQPISWELQEVTARSRFRVLRIRIARALLFDDEFVTNAQMGRANGNACCAQQAIFRARRVGDGDVWSNL
jgi:hypothetical protein